MQEVKEITYKILNFWKEHWVAIINISIFLYVVCNPDRLGTWVGHFLLNIKLIMEKI